MTTLKKRPPELCSVYLMYHVHDQQAHRASSVCVCIHYIGGMRILFSLLHRGLLVRVQVIVQILSAARFGITPAASTTTPAPASPAASR